MHRILNATDVRRDFGQFIDDVVRVKPAVVKRNRDFFAALSLEHLKFMLSGFTFRMTHEQEEDGSLSGSLAEMDLVANAETEARLRAELANQLIEYAEEYMENFQLYYNSPNRRSHFPYVLHVLLYDQPHEIERLIHA